jgi:hypothetical protein
VALEMVTRHGSDTVHALPTHSCTILTDDAARRAVQVARGCPRLKRLVLRDCNALTAAALPTFAMFEQLEYLDVAGCEGLLTFTTRVSTHGAARLAELSALPERCLMLKALVVYACTYVPRRACPPTTPSSHLISSYFPHMAGTCLTSTPTRSPHVSTSSARRAAVSAALASPMPSCACACASSRCSTWAAWRWASMRTEASGRPDDGG